MTLEDSLREEYPADAEALIAALDAPRTHALVLHPNKMTDERFLSLFPKVQKHPFVPHAYFYDPSVYDFGKSFLYDVGAFSIQDASSMMVPYLLDPKPGERVLDLCAAPGGKTILASFLMEDKGLILANDISFPRAKTLSRAVERMGRGNIIVNSSDFSFSSAHFEGFFDKILLDAPCSGSAMARKNDEARKEWSPSKVHRCALEQAALLDLCAPMLRKGGILSYSTCSFSKEENEDCIRAFLDRHEDFVPLNAPIDSPLFYHDATLKEGIHFLPHLFPGEGQYVILLRKLGEAPRKEFAFKKDPLTRKYDGFLESLGLKGRENVSWRGKFYSLSEPFPLEKLNTLRLGVKLFELRDIYFPDHALARFLGPEHSIALDEKNALAYLRGETFPLEGVEGFRIVSFDGLNLGWVKVVKGIAKNHYPKGLRHAYETLNSSR